MGRNIVDSFRRVFSQPLGYPLLIYLVGLVVVLKYILTTNYLGGATVCSEFALYMHYTTGAGWHPISGIFSLQNSCLFVTWLPAQLQIITGIEPTLFYKAYHALILPLLPMVAFFIFKLFVQERYALLGSLFIIGTVTFLQSPSMARTTIALIFYALLLLIIFKEEVKYRIPLAIGLSLMLVLSHYTTAFITFAILSGALVVLAIRWLSTGNKSRQIGVSLIIMVTLFCGGVVWNGMVNSQVFWMMNYRATRIFVSVENSIVNSAEDSIGIMGSISNISSRDKVIQAAFGKHHPDGDTIFQFNWWLFVISWLVVALITWGMIRSLSKRKLPIEFLVISAMCFLLIAITILAPEASRGYGIERVFYQCAPLFGVLLVKGVGDSKHYSWVALLILVIAYGYLNMNYGVIHSITGG